MPHSFELPRMRSAVIKLMCRERFASFFRRVVNKLVALTFRHSVRRGRRFAGGRSGLKPGLTTIVGALNNLSKPAAGLRRVNAVRIHSRTFHVINLPAGEVRPADIPIFPFSVRSQNECALAGAYEYSYVAHLFVPSLVSCATKKHKKQKWGCRRGCLLCFFVAKIRLLTVSRTTAAEIDIVPEKFLLFKALPEITSVSLSDRKSV